jgi:hypothetical protein
MSRTIPFDVVDLECADVRESTSDASHASEGFHGLNTSKLLPLTNVGGMALDARWR